MAYAAERRVTGTGRLPAFYLAVWCLLALLALGYLALLALRPDLAAGLIVRPVPGAPETNLGQRAAARMLAEIEDLKRVHARLEAEIGELKSAVAAQERAGRTREERLAALEAAQRGSAAPVARATPAAQVAEAAPSAGEALAGATVEGSVEERQTKAGRSSAPAPRAAAAAGGSAPAAEARPAPLGLLVATGPSLDAVRLSWQLLQDSHKAALKSLEPRYVESGTDPPAYQLIAGPLTSRETANRACERLKARQLKCAVIPFAGQPL